MTSIASIVTIIVIFNNIKSGLLISQHPKLLVVSYDAFRYDYFDRNVTPFMNRMKKENTHVDYMMNIFVTKTFPNHHTMATGLYAESHGVVDNEFYDPASGNVTKYSYKLYHYNNDVLPIWTINEKSGKGRHSGTMMWPGGVFEYHGTAPTFTQTYNGTVPWKERIDTLISWFKHETNPINLGILYIEEPDYHGHAIGITGPAFDQILNKLDKITAYLHNKLNENGLTDVNVVHLSDHGMAAVKLDRIINLTNYINDTDYTFVGTSPGLHIYPNPGKEEMIFQTLKSAAKETREFRVYKREEIPKKYHYGNNTRVGPIFVIAEVGYAFQNLLASIEYYKKAFNITVDSNSEFGLHGYDNEVVEMHPMFFAKGPAFTQKCKLEPFNNTDLFPLFCKILQLECPMVNGTLKHISKCLVEVPNADKYLDNYVLKYLRNISIIQYQIIFVAVTLAITVVGIIGAMILLFIKKRRIRSRMYHKKSYYTLD